MTKIASHKNQHGYVEQLYKTKKRYYRIVRSWKGSFYYIYTNDSEYGEPEYDRPMYFRNKIVREWTIKDCTEDIAIYEMFE